MGNAHVKPHPKPRNKKQVRWKAADRPSPPGKPTLVAGNEVVPDIIQICWSKPQKDGGSVITAYLVEHKRVGSPHWTKASLLPVQKNELAVNGLEPGWRYQFRVLAENAVGLSDASEVSEPYTVTLQRSAITAPKFTQELKDTVVLEDGKVDLEVDFLGQPTPSICWFKDGFEIFSSNRTRITTTSDKSILTILRSAATDEGEIKCTATNKAGHTSTKAKLTIEAPPIIRLPKSYQDQDGIIFEIGETIHLNVTVSGRPTPLVFWSHDGESMQNDDRHELEYNDKIATIKIENAMRSDRGEYQIRAVNKLGQDQSSFLVTITDKPTPPGKARVLLTSGRSVTLSWSTPEDDGGCRIGNYIIEYYRVGWNVWLKAATSRQLSTILGDLIEGSQYKFRVKAESPYGVSDPSEETEVVFIPDQKRGINEPADVINRISNQSAQLIDNSRNRRANSSPRVSFAINEDVPVRPDRKKNGKTPEASPRMKRRKFSVPLIKTNSSSAILTDEYSSKRSVISFHDRKPLQTPSPIDIPTSPRGSPTSTTTQQISPNRPELRIEKAPLLITRNGKNKTPSPEIIVTDESINITSTNENTQKNSLKTSPTLRRGSVNDNPLRNHNNISNSKREKSPQVKDRTPSPKEDNRMRPPLIHQNFSGSSEFMLVLCPEGEQGTKFRKFDISFEENSLPPPISLSAPELGVEPPDQPILRRSASSTELLNYRLMERLNEAQLEEEEERMAMESAEQSGRRVSLGIPEIHVNSKPANELVGIERQLSLNRRFSSGGTSPTQLQWPLRRQSLKNANEFGTDISSKLNKFQDDDKLRDFSKYRQQEENEQKFEDNENQSKSWKNDWNYEESMSSDEGTESSNDERKNFLNPTPKKYDYDEEQETYNPRIRMMTAVKADTEKPFEILTVRKDPPDSNIIPKPILKKKPQYDLPEKETPLSNENNLMKNGTVYQRRRSNSLVETVDDFSLGKPQNTNIFHPSDDLLHPREEPIDAYKITSPNTKRRSLSLIPAQANLLKSVVKGKNKNDIPAPYSPQNDQSPKVSALANFTRIAGAGVVIPGKLIEKKDTEEEAKVVVDFYGDIVKSYGGKTKPMAEFSRSVVSKYDTFEERNWSEIKPSKEKSLVNTMRVFDKPVESNRILPPVNRISPSPKVESQDNIEYKLHEKTMETPVRIETQIVQNYKKNIIPATNVSPLRGPSPQPKNRRGFSPDKPNSRNFTARGKSPETPHSRSNSRVRGKRAPRSRDASTSPVRFGNWDSSSSLRNSLERDFYSRSPITSSTASSRASLSPVRRKLREITTQTSFRVEPKSVFDNLKEHELASKAEKRVKGIFEYFTDLAMVSVACWLYLFQNEYYAIPVLVILVYRQLNEKLSETWSAVKRRMPRWITRRFESKKND